MGAPCCREGQLGLFPGSGVPGLINTRAGPEGRLGIHSQAAWEEALAFVAQSPLKALAVLRGKSGLRKYTPSVLQSPKHSSAQAPASHNSPPTPSGSHSTTAASLGAHSSLKLAPAQQPLKPQGRATATRTWSPHSKPTLNTNPSAQREVKTAKPLVGSFTTFSNTTSRFLRH